MSFDSRSIDRLRALGKQLPQELQIQKSSFKKPLTTDTSNTHPLETEEDPEKLFQELIKASPDGQIPKHLIDRLREVEEKHSIKANSKLLNTPHNKSTSTSHKKSSKTKLEDDNLYISFQQLLLEEEDD